MNNQSIDSKKLDDFYEEILPSIKNFLKDYLLPSVISPENKNEEYVSKFLGDLLQEKLEKIISEELASEELALENSITNDVLVGNNQNENLDNEIPVPSIETIEVSRQKSFPKKKKKLKKRNNDSDEFPERPVKNTKRTKRNNSKPLKKQRLTKWWSVKAMMMIKMSSL